MPCANCVHNSPRDISPQQIWWQSKMSYFAGGKSRRKNLQNMIIDYVLMHWFKRIRCQGKWRGRRNTWLSAWYGHWRLSSLLSKAPLTYWSPMMSISDTGFFFEKMVRKIPFVTGSSESRQVDFLCFLFSHPNGCLGTLGGWMCLRSWVFFSNSQFASSHDDIEYAIPRKWSKRCHLLKWYCPL